VAHNDKGSVAGN